MWPGRWASRDREGGALEGRVPCRILPHLSQPCSPKPAGRSLRARGSVHVRPALIVRGPAMSTCAQRPVPGG